MEEEKTIQTYATSLPDHVGAFMDAGRTFSSLGMNITRVSYNKSVDLNMLFIDAEGTEQQHEKAHEILKRNGYLKDGSHGDVVLLEFRIPDEPGQVVRVLEVISSFNFNISYISSHQIDAPYQDFRMGLFVDDTERLERFLEKVRTVCPVKIIDYDKSDINYDNTVFYGSFTDSIVRELDLDEKSRETILVNTNLAMQTLDETGLSPYTTFENISKFAGLLSRTRNEGFEARITKHRLSDKVSLTLIEPPCGSNTAILKYEDEYLFMDTGYALYKDEMTALFRDIVPEWDSIRKKALLTHADVDHCGLINMFDEVLVNERTAESLILEAEGEDAFREMNPLHRPYIKLCKTMTAYEDPVPEKLKVLWNSPDEVSGMLDPIGYFSFGDMNFSVYEGAGGHLPGEIVLIDYENRVAFSGDVFVNLKDMTAVQTAYNRCAPVLMTSVDTDPKKCAAERKELFSMLTPGEWTVYGAHGAPYRYEA